MVSGAPSTNKMTFSLVIAAIYLISRGLAVRQVIDTFAATELIYRSRLWLSSVYVTSNDLMAHIVPIDSASRQLISNTMVRGCVTIVNCSLEISLTTQISVFGLRILKCACPLASTPSTCTLLLYMTSDHMST